MSSVRSPPGTRGGAIVTRRTRPRNRIGGMNDVRAVLSRDITVLVFREGAPEVNCWMLLRVLRVC